MGIRKTKSYAVRTAYLAAIICLGCSQPPQRVVFEVLPPDTELILYTNENCYYCDLAKADGVVNYIEQTFNIPVITEIRTPPVPLLSINGKEIPLYYEGYLETREKRLQYLAGQIALTIRNQQ